MITTISWIFGMYLVGVITAWLILAKINDTDDVGDPAPGGIALLSWFLLIFVIFAGFIWLKDTLTRNKYIYKLGKILNNPSFKHFKDELV